MILLLLTLLLIASQPERFAAYERAARYCGATQTERRKPHDVGSCMETEIRLSLPGSPGRL